MYIYIYGPAEQATLYECIENEVSKVDVRANKRKKFKTNLIVETVIKKPNYIVCI